MGPTVVNFNDNCTSAETVCDAEAHLTCNYNSGKCGCAFGFKQVGKRCSSANSSPRFNDPCEFVPQSCGPDLQCSNGFCTCKLGQVYSNGKCHWTFIGDTCSQDSDCKYIANSHCVDNKCHCLAGFNFFNISLTAKGEAGMTCLPRNGNYCEKTNLNKKTLHYIKIYRSTAIVFGKFLF